MKKAKKLLYSQKIAPYVFVVPFVLSLLIFWLYPLVSGISMSFQDVSFGGMKWVGAKHFKKLLGDKVFRIAVGNSLEYMVLTLLLITTAIGKMFLYISVYGLTAYRILSLTFMLWLTIIFVGWIIRQWKTFPLARISILTGAVLYTLLCVLPVSSLCRYYNLWAQTHGFLH